MALYARPFNLWIRSQPQLHLVPSAPHELIQEMRHYFQTMLNLWGGNTKRKTRPSCLGGSAQIHLPVNRLSMPGRQLMTNKDRKQEAHMEEPSQSVDLQSTDRRMTETSEVILFTERNEQENELNPFRVESETWKYLKFFSQHLHPLMIKHIYSNQSNEWLDLSVDVHEVHSIFIHQPMNHSNQLVSDGYSNHRANITRWNGCRDKLSYEYVTWFWPSCLFVL